MDVARARRRWMREQGMFDLARLVFIDETSTNTAMVRLRGRCPRGIRLIDHVPQGIGRRSLSSPACAAARWSRPSCWMDQ